MTQGKVENTGTAAEVKKEMAPQNKRRKELGVEVHYFDDDPNIFFPSANSRYIRDLTTELDLAKRFSVGVGHFERSDRMNLLRRSKLFLARRSFSDLSDEDKPKLYGAKNKIETVLDCFPSVKYSYSSSLPPKVVMRNHGIPEDFYGRRKPDEVRYFDVCCAPDGSAKKARMSDVSRSANIRLDPMDAPRQLFIYRCRIRRCIAWGYSVGLVPIMMTLTLFHRWHPLRKLLRVLGLSWDRFFASGRPAVMRTKQMGVQAYIRRLEETITNGDSSQGYNSGWHPHYHVILFVPKDKVSVISDMEDELQESWFEIVNHFFKAEFGEEIDPSYSVSFKKHGLVFSRYNDFDAETVIAKQSRCVRVVRGRKEQKRPIRPVDDSDYMAKTVGCDPQMLYTGDSEMTLIHAKNSRIPFDLLCDDTAENNDLWVEYALATKGLRSFVFSRGLSSRVRDYFETHPERDTVKSFVKSDKVVAQVCSEAYNLLYRTCRLDDMLRVAVKGYDSLCGWFKSFYREIGFSVSDITEDMMPLPPNTCLPFGDRIDILTFVQRSKLKTNDTVQRSASAMTEVNPAAGQMSTLFNLCETNSEMSLSACSSPEVSNSFTASPENLLIKSTTASTLCDGVEAQISNSSRLRQTTTNLSLSSSTVENPISARPSLATETSSDMPVSAIPSAPASEALSAVRVETESGDSSAPPSPPSNFDKDTDDFFDEETADDDALFEVITNAVPPDNYVAPDERTMYMRLLEHISAARVQLAMSNCRVSEETLQMVLSLLESEGAKFNGSAADAPTAPAPVVPDTPEDSTQEDLSFDDVWVSSESFDPFEAYNDNSIEARLAVVSNSKFYPEWYKERLRRLKAESDRAKAAATSSSAIATNDIPRSS